MHNLCQPVREDLIALYLTNYVHCFWSCLMTSPHLWVKDKLLKTIHGMIRRYLSDLRMDLDSLSHVWVWWAHWWLCSGYLGWVWWVYIDIPALTEGSSSRLCQKTKMQQSPYHPHKKMLSMHRHWKIIIHISIMHGLPWIDWSCIYSNIH